MPRGGYKWVEGVLAPSGKIYCLPRGADNVLIIDPKSVGEYGSNVILSAYFNNL